MSGAFNFASALDKGMNDIDDAPEYGNPADGSHLFLIEKIEQKLLGTKKSPAIQFKYKYLQAIELTDPGADNLSEGGFCSESFGCTEEGLPWLKKHVKDFWDKNPEMSLSQVLIALEGQKVAITTQRRSYNDANGNKKDGWRSVNLILA